MSQENSGGESSNDLNVLLSKFEFGGEGDENAAETTYHPRFSQYKNHATPVQHQQKRRVEYLQRQKDRRDEMFIWSRQLAERNDDTEINDESDVKDEKMDISQPWHQRGRNKNSGQQGNMLYKNRLMLGEWLNEIPDDFTTEWVMIPCPRGRRALVVASNSVTKAYSKNGFFVRKYQSVLPGGGSRCEGKSSLYTLLDCFFDTDSKCYYVLDVMSWNGIDMLNCELDGFLFYHKRTFYTSGSTPLVGWLKPFMLPEILEVLVPENFMMGHEAETAAHFIQKFREDYREKQTRQDVSYKTELTTKNQTMEDDDGGASAAAPM